MSERHFEQSMNPKEHIQSELEDAGISHPSEWRKALDLESSLNEAEEKFASIEGRDYKKILTYLEDDRLISDKEKIKQFSETHDSIERLEILHSMSLTDAVACIRDYAESDSSYRYLAGRLNFYQKLISGQATKKQTESKYDKKKREYVQVEKEYPIDASSANPETIRVGLLRDIEFSSMIGTPELAVYQITEERLKARDAKTKHLLPALTGYNSGIGINAGSGRWLTRHLWLNLENSEDRAQSERIGCGYIFLRKTFEESKALIASRYKGEEPLDEKTLEHRAVIQAANWLEESTNYNDPHRPLGSTYIGSVQESIAWARLGDPSVKKQIRGMRVEIQELDLRNIGRFIGKSGINRYEGEHKRIFGQIKFLREGDENAKQEFTTRENNFAIQKQERWLARETEKVNRWLEKSKAKIATYDIPDAERQEIVDTVQGRYEEKISNLNKDYQDHVDRLGQRSPDELMTALQERQRVVDQRYEKRKSLAQKALDLHFVLNHDGENYGKLLRDLVDWINYAPLGTIKRSHRFLKQGVSEEQIITRALTDIITGAHEATPKDMMTIQKLVQRAKIQDHGAQQKLQEMSKVSNILSRFGYVVPLAEIENLATSYHELAEIENLATSYHEMTEALKMYDLEQVKQFMNQGINLQSVTTVKKVTEKYGHDLSPIEVAEIASHKIDGLDDAMRTFDLEGIRTLLKQDVQLPIAVGVLNNTRQFGYELETSQIASVANNVYDLDDFTAVLKGLPVPEVVKIFSDNISFSEYSRTKEALQKHQLDSSFEATHAIAKKLTRTREYSYLGFALDTFNLEEIEQVLDKGYLLRSVLDVCNAFKIKEIPTNFQEIILFEKYTGDYYDKGQCVIESIDAFGIDNVRKIIAKSCRVDIAIEINYYINGDSSQSHRYGSRDYGISVSMIESLKKGGLDVIIAIAKAGNMEAVVKTIEAGFTVEEITRFPFLISPLLRRNNNIIN